MTSPQYPEGGWNDGVGRAGSFTFTPNGSPTSPPTSTGSTPRRRRRSRPARRTARRRSSSPRATTAPTCCRYAARTARASRARSAPTCSTSTRGTAPRRPLDRWTRARAPWPPTARAPTTPPCPARPPGRRGKTGLGLRLDGTGAYAQTNGPAVSTQRNFTVTAWARLTSTNATATVRQPGRRADRWLRPAVLQGRRPLGAEPYRRGRRRGAERARAFRRRRRGSASGPTSPASTTRRPRNCPCTSTAGWSRRSPSPSRGTRPGRWPSAGGRSTGPAAEFWPGDLDEVRVYGRAMFADEVADLVNSAATLVGHWKLDEESGTTPPTPRARAPPRHWPAPPPGAKAGWTAGSRSTGVNGHAQAGAPAVNTKAGFTVAVWTQLDYLPTRDAAAVSQSGHPGRRLPARLRQGEGAVGPRHGRRRHRHRRAGAHAFRRRTGAAGVDPRGRGLRPARGRAARLRQRPPVRPAPSPTT